MSASALGGYGPAPEFVEREARAAGPIRAGAYRVISVDGGFHVSEHDTLEAARRHADDVASEADYDDVPPAAYIVDSDFECVDIGVQHSLRKGGMSAWDSYQRRDR